MFRKRPEPNSFEASPEAKTFRDLEIKIMPLIADEDYDSARGEIRKELLSLADILGGDRNEQFRKLKEKFEAGLPEEIQQLIDPESPEARARATHARVEQFARVEERLKKEGQEPSREEQPGEKPEMPASEKIDTTKFVAERSWSVPEHGQIVPGMILTVRLQKEGGSLDEKQKGEDIDKDVVKFKVLSRPSRGGDPAVYVEDLGTNKKFDITLADMGIEPYTSNNLWNAHNRPLGWWPPVKEKEKKERE